jgi:hypothetical protein
VRMRRLNVAFAQLNACVQNHVFALPTKPKLERGDLLLLQLNKGDAQERSKLHSRIEYAIVFDHSKEDVDGSILHSYWPDASPAGNWSRKWIIYGSKTIETKPFSLEDLGLSKNYETQNIAIWIDKKDENTILPYIYY